MMFLQNKVRHGRNGFLYIPLRRSRELLICVSVFLLITLVMFSLLNMWVIAGINIFLLIYFILYNPVYIINKEKKQYRKSNTFYLFPGTWKSLADIEFISIFPVSFGTENFGRPDIYRMRTEFTMAPAEKEYLSDGKDKQIHLYFVTRSRQRIWVARYRNRKSALSDARFLSDHTGLSIWNAADIQPHWDENTKI